jgi:hypothetical protein
MGTNGTLTHRLKLELSSDNITWVEYEMRYFDFTLASIAKTTGVFKNTRDHQFLSSFNNDINKTGVYSNHMNWPGMFLLYNPAWDTEENIQNDGLLLGVSSMNSNNTLSGSNVITLANSPNVIAGSPAISMTANGLLPLVADAFGSGKNAILTRWGANNTGMFSTTNTITLGGVADGTSVEFTIYFLGRNALMTNATEVGLFSFGLPTATSRSVNYHAEFTRYTSDTYGAITTPGALSRVFGGNEFQWIGLIGNRDINTYPKYQTSFEVWCITKYYGLNTVEVYLNNQLVTTTLASPWSTNTTTWAKRASGYWQLGDGSSIADRGNGSGTGTYIGAFQVYNKYHPYSARCGVLRSLMKTFYIPTQSIRGITATTLTGITLNTKTAPFTITIDDYPHRNVQSLNDFYVFFAPQGSIPTSINILENNVTSIDASVNFDVKLTCTAMTRSSGAQVLCLAISMPGASNTDPATKILTFVGNTFTP